MPIAVIYCPLCDSASVVDRRLDGKTLEFGVSGLLYNSNVLMYDRTDHALWSQVLAKAVSGPHAGKALRHLDGWEVTSFGDWKARHPGSTVLGFRTGHIRDYGRNPYAKYLRSEGLRFPIAHEDDRLPAKAVVIGVVIGETARAYPLEELMAPKDGVTRDTVAGHEVEFDLWQDPAQKTGDGPKRVSVGITQAPPGARVLHTFWFAWSATHPKTDIYRAPRPSPTP